MKILLSVTCVIFSFFSSAESLKCERLSTLSNYEKILGVIKVQAAQVGSVLDGKLEEDIFTNIN